MLGRFTDTNLFLDATISGPAAGWSTAFPLANLLKEEDYVGSPARCLAASDLGLSWFEVVLPEPRVLNLSSLFFHSMSLNARYRIRGSSLDDPGYAAASLDTGWQWVFPSLYDPEELEFGVENFWTGTVTEGEANLLKRHLYAPLAEALVERVKVEFDDQEHPNGWFDIGGLHGASGFSPVINFNRGRELSVTLRDLVVTMPSGRRIAERRVPMRVLSVSYSNLQDPEARRFVDAVLRVRSVGTVLFVPDLDDAAATMREAFPATFGKPPSARIGWPGLASTEFTLEEILA